MSDSETLPETAGIERLEQILERNLQRLEQARPFAKQRHQSGLLDICRRLLVQPPGVERLYRLAPRLDAAGIFAGTDWDDPATLQSSLVAGTLEHGSTHSVVLECLSELRLLAIAKGEAAHAGISAEQARHYLTQVLALNLNRLFGETDEASRANLGPLAPAISEVFRHILAQIGFQDILGNLVEEIWRLLAQRPIEVRHIKAMITRIAVTVASGVGGLGETRLGADRLISALFGPTQGCLDDPGLEAYATRLAAMDDPALQQEAYGFARAMHDVGLVSDYHVAFLQWVLAQQKPHLVPQALGLSSTGIDALRCYPELVHRLIGEIARPQTAQSIYGLALLLERGILYAPPIAPALWRQIQLRLSPQAESLLSSAYGPAESPRVHLLAGTIALLGQPLGVGQGNNPTCQAARALSMWSLNDPDYLLHLIAHAALHDSITMHFEGQELVSAQLPAGLLRSAVVDTDPVSMLLVPHLDRIYLEMGRRCADRGEDPHRWVNPEFHGWWVGREFEIAVDITSGALREHEAFLKRFYGSYHPFYNGNQPVIHPQPAGIAVTDSNAAFVGWHAITLLRVALDQEEVMRFYFFNPNNDSGQHWGKGVVVSTSGHGERHGESSLPFDQLASRLYLFHDDAAEDSARIPVPADELQAAMAMANESWAGDRAG